MLKLMIDLEAKKTYGKTFIGFCATPVALVVAQATYKCRCGEVIKFFSSPGVICKKCQRVLPPIDELRYASSDEKIMMYRGDFGDI